MRRCQKQYTVSETIHGVAHHKVILATRITGRSLGPTQIACQPQSQIPKACYKVTQKCGGRALGSCGEARGRPDNGLHGASLGLCALNVTGRTYPAADKCQIMTDFPSFGQRSCLQFPSQHRSPKESIQRYSEFS